MGPRRTASTCQSSAVSDPCPILPVGLVLHSAICSQIHRQMLSIWRAGVCAFVSVLCSRSSAPHRCDNALHAQTGEVPSLFAETAAVTKAAGSFHMRTAARHADWRLAPGANLYAGSFNCSRERSPEAASRRAGLKSGSQNAIALLYIHGRLDRVFNLASGWGAAEASKTACFRGYSERCANSCHA